MAPFSGQPMWASARIPGKTHHFWLFNGSWLVAGSPTLASHCRLAAATQMRAKEPTPSPKFFKGRHVQASMLNAKDRPSSSARSWLHLQHMQLCLCVSDRPLFLIADLIVCDPDICYPDGSEQLCNCESDVKRCLWGLYFNVCFYPTWLIPSPAHLSITRRRSPPPLLLLWNNQIYLF